MCWYCMNRLKLEDELGMTTQEARAITGSPDLAMNRDWRPLEKFVGPHGKALLKAYRIKKEAENDHI